MAPPPKISKETWDEHKTEILSLYKAKVSKQDILKHLAETRNFCPTPSQYEAQKVEWTLKRLVTRPEWQFIGHHIEKRKLDNKESEVVAYGDVVPAKKVRRSVAKAAKGCNLSSPSFNERPEGAANVTVRTPPPMLTLTGNEEFVVGLPFTKFEFLMDRYIDQFCKTNAIGHAQQTSSLCWEIDNVAEVADFSFWNASIPNLIDHDVPIEAGTVPGQKSNQVEQLGLQMRKLLGECLQTPVSANPQKCMDEILQGLKKVVVERFPGDLLHNVRQFFTASTEEMILQLLRYAAYLASNRLLPGSAMNKILQWTLEKDMFGAIEYIVSLNLPTTEAFATDVLNSAIELKNIDVVRKLLESGVNPNARNGLSALKRALYSRQISITRILLRYKADEWGLLHRTISSGCHCSETVRMLIDSGADPNEDYNGMSILHMAIYRDLFEIAKILLQKGADVNHICHWSSITPLQFAAKRGNSRMVELLIRFKSDINTPSGFKFKLARRTAAEEGDIGLFFSPLQHAIAARNTEVVDLLLRRGADANGFDASGYICGSFEEEAEFGDEMYFTEPLSSLANEPRFKFQLIHSPLQYAAMWGNMELALLLLSKHAIADDIGGNGTALQLACGKKGNIAMVQLLLSKGADVNIPASRLNGHTALQRAAMCGDTGIVHRLLEAGADIHAEAAPGDGLTAIEAAVRYADPSLAKQLISCRSENDRLGMAYSLDLLQAAAERGHLPLLQYLLELEPDIEQQLGDIDSGLRMIKAAVKNNHVPVVGYLLECGVNITTISDELLSIALDEKDAELQNLLLDHLSRKAIKLDGSRSLLSAISNGDIDKVQLLTSYDATIIAFALQLAARLGNLPICIFLVSKGAIVSGDSGTAAVYEAVAIGHAQIMMYLLSHGASPDWKPATERFSRRSPLAGACHALGFKSKDMVTILLKHGANPNANGGAALCGAIVSNNCEVVNILLAYGADMRICGDHHLSPLEHATRRNCYEMVQRLMKAGTDLNVSPGSFFGAALCSAVENDNISIVQLLIDGGADINRSLLKLEERTPLQQAAKMGRLPMVVLLLKNGADVNAPSSVWGQTALEAAAENGRLEIAVLLMKRDKNPHTLEARREAAAKLAAGEGFLDVTKVLREFKD